jgi:undecaprenyl-diphosphatase
VAEKLMGLDPTSPDMTLMLVMLHTGTMFAVIVYFWRAWLKTYFSSIQAFRINLLYVVVASIVTGVIGLVLQETIRRIFAGNASSFEIENLFGNAKLMAAALAAAGVLIIISSRVPEGRGGALSLKAAAVIGAVQGLCLPFRGFSRSGATISTGLALGVTRRRAEEFSFALAVALTPVVIAKEALRVWKTQGAVSGGAHSLAHLAGPSLLGMALSFLAGLLALRWLSSWLEQGRWQYFGVYCLVASLVVLWVG